MAALNSFEQGFRLFAGEALNKIVDSINNGFGAKFGYGTGVGGTVTQATSKATGVTLNKVCGAITMNAESLAGGAEAAFTLTNSEIAVDDVVVVNIKSGPAANTSYMIGIATVAAGSCDIVLTNLTAGALAETIVLNFAVIKSVKA